MLDISLANKILSVGCEYSHPKGGVAQVLYNYEKYVFPRFNCIVNSGEGSQLRKAWLALLGLIELSLKSVFDKNIKIVHIHTASYNSFKRSAVYVNWAKSFHKKVVLHIHGGGFKEYYNTDPEWISRILDKSDAIITLSESWKAWFQTITKCPVISVINNIVPNLNQTLPPRKEDGKIHLLFLGAVNSEKGVFDLMEVLHEHKEELDGKVMVHIGGKGQIQKLNELIEKCALKSIVKYEGFVSGEKKEQLLHDSDAFILPSYTEGLPVSILEALSYGKPVLSTPVGGIPEVIQHGVNGILFEPRDKDAMYQAIIAIINKEVLGGVECTSSAKKYLPDNVIDQLNDLYTGLLRPK